MVGPVDGDRSVELPQKEVAAAPARLSTVESKINAFSKSSPKSPIQGGKSLKGRVSKEGTKLKTAAKIAGAFFGSIMRAIGFLLSGLDAGLSQGGRAISPKSLKE